MKTLLHTPIKAAGPEAEETFASCRIPMLFERVTSSTTCQPVTVGIPLPQGCVFEATHGRLVQGAHETPVQTEALLRWGDGSIQWLLADFLAQVREEEHSQAELHLESAAPVRSRLGRVNEQAATVLIHNGSIAFQLAKTFDRFLSVPSVLDAARVVLVDARQRTHVPRFQHWQVLTQGPVRTTWELCGNWPACRGLRLRVRLSFYAGTGLVKVEVSLHNPHRARHKGGLWDLGDPGSILFKEAALELKLVETEQAEMVWQLERAAPPIHLKSAAELYQDSSGGDHWQSRNHVNREGRVPCRFRGYQWQAGTQRLEGYRAEPTVTVRTMQGGCTLTYPEFWQQFPKAFSYNDGNLRVGLFPAQWDDLHELQGGERKSHTFWLSFCGPGEEPESLDWTFAPALVRPSLVWVEDTRALPPLDIPAGPVRERLECYLSGTLTGERSIYAHRERVDEYGWRHYGELFADHEQTYYIGPQPLISHYNNQFDPVQGFLLHYLRTGDPRWHALGDALARHVMDIDIYHTHEDRAAYNGGLFWFTDHYKHAGTSTHRTYSRSNALVDGQPYGGGPSSNHNFTSGLLLYYALTGNTDAKAVVIELADWVLAMDDGKRNLLGVVADGATGLASATGDLAFHGPGRGGGNSINALLDAWRLTRQSHYLEYAEALLRRCIHPADDLQQRKLLEVEKKWSYTVFLSSLVKYLDLKAAAGAFDAMYSYAQDSLLHYGTWMAEHEQPYFEQREQLEYPTEAWAAQEFRKANVLRLAARHAEEPMRQKMLEKGQVLSQRAWDDLLRFESRNCIRAAAIIMTEGLLDAHFATRPLETVPTVDVVPATWSAPAEFISQRQQVRRMLKSPGGILRLLGRVVNPWRWQGVGWSLR